MRFHVRSVLRTLSRAQNSTSKRTDAAKPSILPTSRWWKKKERKKNRKEKSATETHRTSSWTSSFVSIGQKERKWLWQRNNFRHPVPNNRPYAAPNAGRMPETPELVVFSRDVKQYAVQRVENAIAAGGRHETLVCVRLYFVFHTHTCARARARTHARRTPHARTLETLWMAMSIEFDNYEKFERKHSLSTCLKHCKIKVRSSPARECCYSYLCT